MLVSSEKCVQCGYMLRGVPQDACCAECGLAVIESIPTSLTARKHRFRPLRRAGLWMAVPVLPILPVVLISMILGEHVDDWWFDVTNTALVLGILVLTPAAVLGSSSVLVRSIMDHRLHESDSAKWLFAPLSVLAPCVAAAFVGLPIVLILAIPCVIVLLAAWAAHVRAIALDMAHLQLARHALIAAIGVPLLVIAVFVLTIARFFAQSGEFTHPISAWLLSPQKVLQIDSELLTVGTLVIPAVIVLAILGIHMTVADPQPFPGGITDSEDLVS